MKQQGMGKILSGILKYQKTIIGELKPFFREILDKPAPKSIIVSCVDSRIVASRLLQAEPGAYFLIRNPGNFIPKYECLDTSVANGTPAAFELACVHNKVNTIVVLGHSDSKPLNMLFQMRSNLDDNMCDNTSELKKWLVLNGRDTVEKFKSFENSGFKQALKFSEYGNQFEAYIDPENKFSIADKFSQINTLEQLKNINNYNFLKEKISNNQLRGYALWIDLKTSDIYMFSYKEKRFINIDENSYDTLYKECQIVQQ